MVFENPRLGKIGHGPARAGRERSQSLASVGEKRFHLRVAHYHTYFVGCDEWGFSVWAHNSYDQLHTAAQAGFLDAAGNPVLTRRQTSGILSSALRHGNGDHVATAQRIAQSLEERGLPLTVADQRAAAFVEAALEGHFTPAQITEASFMLRGNAIHADFTARVAAGGGPAVLHPGANPADFWNGVFPANRRDHVLMGEVHHTTAPHPVTGVPTTTTSATGFHHTAGGGGMITGPATAGPNAVGIGRYPVSIIDQATGIAYPKTNGGGRSTLFPASWSQGRVVAEIYAAFLDRARISTSAFHGSHTWEGLGFTPGLRVQGYEFITPPAGLPAGIRSAYPLV